MFERISTPVPDFPKHTQSSGKLRLLLANDHRIKLRHLLYRFRATQRLAPHLPDHPSFLTPGLLRLLARNAPASLHADDECLLAQCVKYGQEDCIQFLFECGADANAGWGRSIKKPAGLGKTPMQRRWSEERTDYAEQENPPLLIAVRQGRVAIAKMFIEAGVNLALDCSGRLVAESTRLGQWGILELLLAHGAPVPHSAAVLESIVVADTMGEADLYRVWQLLFALVEDRRNALALCCRHGNLRLLHYLVGVLGVSVAHLTPACTESLPILHYLLENGMCKYRKANLRDLLRNSHLRSVTRARLLVELGGADPNADNGRAVRECARLGCADILEYLIVEAKADLERFGVDALRIAITHGRPNIVRVLLDHDVQLPFTELDCHTDYCPIACGAYLSFEFPHAIHLHLRASPERLRLCESEYAQAMIEFEPRLIEVLREIAVRSDARICYWLEDSLVEQEAVTVPDQEYYSADELKSDEDDRSDDYTCDYVGRMAPPLPCKSRMGRRAGDAGIGLDIHMAAIIATGDFFVV